MSENKLPKTDIEPLVLSDNPNYMAFRKPQEQIKTVEKGAVEVPVDKVQRVRRTTF